MTERIETLALLFTDIEGSTNLLRSLGASYRTLLAEHRRVLGDAFAAHGGTVLGHEGDALFVTFADPSSAILGAIDGQLALTRTKWPADSHVRVRMGIHVGEVTIDEDDDYVGLAVHQAARISAAAHGGQVLTSKAMQHARRTAGAPRRVSAVDRTLSAQGLPGASRPVPVASS